MNWRRDFLKLYMIYFAIRRSRNHKLHLLPSVLQISCPQPDTAQFYPRESFWDPILVNDITWNFEKFLVSPSGVPLYRFRPKVDPFDLKDIMKLLIIIPSGHEIRLFPWQRSQREGLSFRSSWLWLDAAKNVKLQWPGHDSNQLHSPAKGASVVRRTVN